MIGYVFLDAIRERTFLFWSLVFPILLSSLFYMAFGGLIYPEAIKLKIGLSTDNTYAEFYQKIDVLDVMLMDLESGKKALLDDEIITYIDANNLVIAFNNGATTSIIKSIADQMEQVSALGISGLNIDFSQSYVNNQKTGKDIKLYYGPFYALIAMMAMYSSFGVLESVVKNMANLSATGIRIESSPKTKQTLLVNAIIISVLLNFVFNLVLVGYITLVLGITLFTSFAFSILIILSVNIFGACLGLVLSVANRLSYAQKNGLIVVSSLLLSYLSGMMDLTMRVKINQVMPWLKNINPIVLATEGLYQVNQYGDYSHIMQYVFVILLISVVLFTLSVFRLRRRNYDYI